MSNRVQALPPTFSIEDPAVRSFCDALANAWELRNGNIGADDSKRFITKEEFDGLARDAFVSTFAGAAEAVTGGGGKPIVSDGTGVGPILDIIDQLIRGSALYDALNRRVDLIEPPQETADALLEEIRNQLADANAAIVAINTITNDSSSASARTVYGNIARINTVEAAVITESQARATADEAVASQVTVLTARVNSAESSIVNERTARTTSDTSFVSAVNTLWGTVGNSNALVQNGSTVSVNPSVGQATKWNQVQAAVTDPNTGAVSSSAILQETRAYANSANNEFNTSWTVRTTISHNGTQVVGGFGLMATNGAGSPDGPTIDFGVVANKFWIAAPQSGWNNSTAANDLVNGGAGYVPFTVLTTPTTFNNVLLPAGVYMRKAAIGDATIDTAKIAQHINSTNFNGSFNTSGNIASFGSAGWAIDKAGTAVFNNVKVRGDVEATTIKADVANIVKTLMVDGNAITASAAAIGWGGNYTGSSGSAFTSIYLPQEAAFGGSFQPFIIDVSWAGGDIGPNPGAGTFMLYATAPNSSTRGPILTWDAISSIWYPGSGDYDPPRYAIVAGSLTWYYTPDLAGWWQFYLTWQYRWTTLVQMPITTIVVTLGKR